jgi:hypothetical protein
MEWGKVERLPYPKPGLPQLTPQNYGSLKVAMTAFFVRMQEQLGKDRSA